MAKFNEKVLCLFSKNTQQIQKEAQRRGISTYTNVNGNKSRERMIAEIIYKDAYDCGRGNPINTDCPVNCRGMAEPETAEYEIYDCIREDRYKAELTEDQIRLLDWLSEKNLLGEVEYCVWDEPYRNIGRI
jgi:hypothetical protein